MSNSKYIRYASLAASIAVMTLPISSFAGTHQKAGDTAGEDESESLGGRLETIEFQERENKWFITPYKPNYVMPFTYMRNPNNEPLRQLGMPEDKNFDNVEMKFQISFMLKAATDILFTNGDLYFAYTQVSFWQAYNRGLSEMFRDTNYEPEMFLMFDTDFDVLGLRNRIIRLGVVHQSNGRGSSVLTRSWNRIYANFILEKENFVLSVKPWLVLEDYENPDIEKYLGYGELRGIYKVKNQVFSVMLRDNLRVSENRGSIEVAWSFPMINQFRGYVQYFYGYGESLMDYDYLNQRIGIGVMLNDWL